MLHTSPSVADAPEGAYARLAAMGGGAAGASARTAVPGQPIKYGDMLREPT